MRGTGRAFIFLIFLLSLFPPRARAAIPSRPDVLPNPVAAVGSAAILIRARLDSVATSFSLSGQGLRFSGSANAAAYRAVRVSWRIPEGAPFRARQPLAALVANSPVAAASVAATLEWNLEWTVVDRDSGLLVARIQAPRFEISGQNVRLNLKPIPDRAFLAPQKRRGAALDLVALLPLEEYVRGVLPAEMPSGWPLEALKAQAVAARTYALFRRHEREESGLNFDVETTVMDQVFLMPSPGEARLAVTDQAVRETSGILLSSVGLRPQPLAAYFHADCGGHTEDARAVWGQAGSGTASDAGCPLNPHAQWQVTLSRGEIARAFRARSALRGLTALGRTATGRVDRVRLAWADGSVSEISPHEFRMALGHDRVRSTNFRLTATPQGFSLEGKGFGHGVGLCQWGARHLAREGRGYREILRHYYPQARLIETAQLAHAGEAFAAR